MDPDGAPEVVDSEEAVGGWRAAGAVVETEGAAAAREEVAGVIESMESEEVAAEK